MNRKGVKGVVIYKCDCCRKEVLKNELNDVTLNPRHTEVGIEDYSKSYELCDTCYQRIELFITNEKKLQYDKVWKGKNYA